MNGVLQEFLQKVAKIDYRWDKTLIGRTSQISTKSGVNLRFLSKTMISARAPENLLERIGLSRYWSRNLVILSIGQEVSLDGGGEGGGGDHPEE